MRKYDRFQRGRSTFKCQTCERMTRDTGQGVDHLCEQCFDIAGWDNMINDNGNEPGSPEHTRALVECERLLKIIEKRGGNVANVKACNDFIWGHSNG